MKKYYGYFIYNNEEYVIRFEIDGSLQYDREHKCFKDRDWYIRSIGDVIAMAAIDNHPINDNRFGLAILLDHKRFVEYRYKGIKRWKPVREVIKWD